MTEHPRRDVQIPPRSIPSTQLHRRPLRRSRLPAPASAPSCHRVQRRPLAPARRPRRQGYLHDNKRGDGHSSAIVRCKVPRTARYDLRIAYSPHPTHAAKVPITIQNADVKTRVEFDQTKPLPAGEAFRSAVIIRLTNDGETTVSVTNDGTGGFVILDAIQLLEVKE